MIEGEPRSIKNESGQPLRVACALDGDWEKHAGWPCGHILIRRNQLGKVQTVAVKWLITEGRNHERRGSQLQDCCVLKSKYVETLS
jgi:hypothetical protein